MNEVEFEAGILNFRRQLHQVGDELGAGSMAFLAIETLCAVLETVPRLIRYDEGVEVMEVSLRSAAMVAESIGNQIKFLAQTRCGSPELRQQLDKLGQEIIDFCIVSDPLFA